MGAWIEIDTHYIVLKNLVNSVAPFMGAWIEICNILVFLDVKNTSRPSWARGLKFRV